MSTPFSGVAFGEVIVGLTSPQAVPFQVNRLSPLWQLSEAYGGTAHVTCTPEELTIGELAAVLRHLDTKAREMAIARVG